LAGFDGVDLESGGALRFFIYQEGIEAMRESRGVQLIIYSLGFLTFILATSLFLKPQLWHDPHFFSRVIPSLFGCVLVAGLLTWLLERRRYFKIASALVQIVGFGVLGIHEWIKGNHVFAVIPALACILGFVVLFDEIKTQRQACQASE
jgi:uncharacterized membrane protein YccC